MSQAVQQAAQKIQDALAETLSPLAPEQRGEVCRAVSRALNAYITAAQFQNPPKFRIPEYLKPILEQPAPPRGP